MNGSTLLAIAGMSLATFACRYGGYWLFSHIRPTPALRTVLGYIPGALFVSYVAPALFAGGPMQWIGGAATVVLMLVVRDLSLAVLGGTAIAWVWWSYV
ncbi:AzlD family protein [Acidisphaera sp. L21]|uniref:AzlD family protein n=1 Tax=Acidisphaera sp. L21 TaxID=1641851 RepID=UPI00131EB2D5|nr:AzlD domain-containing protein [Acidisphaera sp. L21]